MKLDNLIIHNDKSLKDCLSKLDSALVKTLLVIDDDDLLIGTLTDGDIRRFLLKGGRLQDNVVSAINRNFQFAYNIDDAKLIFDSNKFLLVPIVDIDKKLVDCYVGDKIDDFIYPKIGIPVVINAGGKGTRLYPFTKILPKPLIPVGDLPIIEHIMNKYINYECSDFHIIIGYKKQLMKAYFCESEKKYNINWYNETKPLGTGGGLYMLKGKIKSTFFFANCDTLITSNYESMVRFHKQNRNDITIVCAYKNVTIPYGTIKLNTNGTVNSMSEKPELSFLTNTGMYLVEPSLLDDLIDGENIGFPDFIIREINNGKKVMAYPISENEWLDMGQLPELEKMRKKIYGE